jgi:hypothetical protein
VHNDGITALPRGYAAGRITAVTDHPRSPKEVNDVGQREQQRRGDQVAVASTGLPAFPIRRLLPRTTPPTSAAIDRNGVVIAIPKSIDTSWPAFTQAATVCDFNSAP